MPRSFALAILCCAAPLDVMIEDLNGDGMPDIYAGNLVGRPVPPATIGLPVADRLYLTTGTPLSWVDQSVLLPDNPLYQGNSAVAPWATVDVEFLDADRDGGTFEILVGSGQKGGGLAPGAMGMRYLIGFGAGTPFGSSPTGLYIPSEVQSVEVNDIETGDWELEFPDLDIGLASTLIPMSIDGMLYLTK